MTDVIDPFQLCNRSMTTFELCILSVGISQLVLSCADFLETSHQSKENYIDGCLCHPRVRNPHAVGPDTPKKKI